MRSKWTKITDVTVLGKIGGGNFGDVFRGKWNRTTDVALKKLKSREHLEEFLREASMLQSLNHPNIVHFFGIHVTPTGESFIVMEYLPEGSLDQVLQMNKNKIHLTDIHSM